MYLTVDVLATLLRVIKLFMAGNMLDRTGRDMFDTIGAKTFEEGTGVDGNPRTI